MSRRGFLEVVSVVLGFALFLTGVSIQARADRISQRGLLPVDDVFEIEIGSRTITCGGPLNGKWVSGSVQEILNGLLFTPATDKVKKLKSQYKKATGTKRTKLKKKLDTANKSAKSNDALCGRGPDAPPPVATATPTRSPTPPAQGNFDSNGNVTAAGKIAFGIPSQLNANRETGRNIYNVTCKGCHDIENQGRTFSTYKNLIQAAPMFIFDQSDQNLADLTAYLNRFRLN